MRVYKLSPVRSRIVSALADIGTDPYALGMAEKGEPADILIKDVPSPAANILKQEAIASGMDAAVKRGVVSCSVKESDVLLLGTLRSIKILIKRLEKQPFGLADLARSIAGVLNARKSGYFIARGEKISYETPLVMGIVNVTPDSFSDGGKYVSDENAEKIIDKLMADGADILDIGGMSSRPGAKIVEAGEEISRISHALEYAVSVKNALVSVDTCSAETAEFALSKGAGIINDITGLRDEKMIKTCASYGAAVCVMHMRGDPSDMALRSDYSDTISEIRDFFSAALEKAEAGGISRQSVIIDPGFGFAKTSKQNFLLLKHLGEFNSLGLPLLAGVSRKSMIGSVTGAETRSRLAGTIAANSAALMAGADIIRVHDVSEGADTVKVIRAVKNAEDR